MDDYHPAHLCICGHPKSRHGWKIAHCYGRDFVQDGDGTLEVPCSCAIFHARVSGENARFQNYYLLQLQMQPMSVRAVANRTQPIKPQAAAERAKNVAGSLDAFGAADTV